MPEGDDCVGHQLNWNTRVGLMERLDAIGIGAITLPSHSMFAEEEDLVRHFRRRRFKALLAAKGPGVRFPLKSRTDWKAVADRVLSLEPDIICPLFLWDYEHTLSDFTGSLSLGEIEAGIHDAVSYLVGRGARIVPWIGDTTRGSVESAVRFSKAIVDAGGDGVYLVDSRGNSHPIATRILVRRVKDAIGGKDVFVQHHNDLGVATANALADVEGGANWIDCTVTGIGDRGGTVCLEEAACLFEMYGIDTGIDLKGLHDLATYVRDAFGIQVAPWKAVIGESWNKEEGNGHLEGATGSEASFGIAPEAVGTAMEMVIGAKILFGKERSSAPTDDPTFVTDLLRGWGVAADPVQLERILLRSRAAVATAYRTHYLTFDEFQRIVEGVMGGPVPTNREPRD
jgi:isopropylmalate/homocitrate/citramalate synthase